MGYIKHDAVIITIDDFSGDRTSSFYRPLPDIEAFRASIPENFRPLVIGPIKAITNMYAHYVLLPDGSKEGWDTSNAGDTVREGFIALFTNNCEGVHVNCEGVHVTYGGDFGCENAPIVQPI